LIIDTAVVNKSKMDLNKQIQEAREEIRRQIEEEFKLLREKKSKEGLCKKMKTLIRKSIKN
jgi:hypothetical protein